MRMISRHQSGIQTTGEVSDITLSTASFSEYRVQLKASLFSSAVPMGHSAGHCGSPSFVTHRKGKLWANVIKQVAVGRSSLKLQPRQ